MINCKRCNCIYWRCQVHRR